jgi:6-phosphofructo-2-kinase
MNSLFDSQRPLSSTTASVTPVLDHDQVPLDLSDVNHKLVSEKLIHSQLQSKINQLRVKSYHSTHDDSIYPNSLSFPDKVVFLMVGLPASGKSTVGKQLHQYFNLYGISSKIYNAGDTRRKIQQNNRADFFDPKNEQGKLLRETYADLTVNELIHDLNHNKIDIGFLDATNTTVERRKRMISTFVENVENPTIVLMDVTCNDELKMNFNIACKTKNADYLEQNYFDAINDFKKRSEHYHKVYEPITTMELIDYPIKVYIKYCNGGEVFEFSRFDRVNPALMKLLSNFKHEYYNSFGKDYESRVRHWTRFLSSLSVDANPHEVDSQVIKSHIIV